jgi:hypothetical protein
VVWEDEIIGMDGVKGDVAFATDLGIGAAGKFEVDGERDWILHKFKGNEFGCMWRA